jgi:hypothetical protein
LNISTGDSADDDVAGDGVEGDVDVGVILLGAGLMDGRLDSVPKRLV